VGVHATVHFDSLAYTVKLGPVVNADRVTVGGITYAGGDAGPALSFDGTLLFFQSVRPGNLGVVFDLYMCTLDGQHAALRMP